jgi:hypothetical protein
MKVEKTHVLLFLGAFVAGCVVVYYTPLEYKTVFVYPTPSNVKRLQYKDKMGSCFRFNAEEVKCGDKSKSIPSVFS